MTTWNPRANELFLKALELASPAERQQYLDGACGADAALRVEVEALLEAGARAGNFLESPARDPRATIEEPIRERPGTVIGPYKLLEPIGEGGFGVVFMADQAQPVRRRVALKVLKPGMDTRQVVARFEAERQALAIMDHPNIAKVHDGGATPSGRPYFVMELVKGVPITEYCDQNQLTPRQRLELFIPICHAVQHAHHKGIIHRDLKPANVLVTMHDTTPVVKVIDFGVAKALGQDLTDRTLFTGFTQMVGTPLYMSPEQAGQSGLDVDTRSDLYSLGVLLYELLTGATPFSKERFKQASYDEIRRIIREEEPPRPSTRLSDAKDSLPSISAQRHTEPAKLTRLVRGELDWIVMKCLEKDRNRRYETASALAADVQRYLDDEPVQACPPSMWYRLSKFARRHRAVLATAATVSAAVLVAIGSLVTAVGVLTASNAEIQANQAQTDEALRRERQANDRLERSLYFQRIALAERELAANNVGRAEELLTECPPKLRGWEWHYLKRSAHDKPRVLTVAKGGIFWALACSADGHYLAASGMSSDVKLIEMPTGKELATLGGHTGPVGPVAFNPQGNQLATGGTDKKIILWDVATRKIIRTLHGHEPFVGMAYRPDGKQLATAGMDGTVRVWDIAAEAEVLSIAGKAGLGYAIAFSPDGRRLASCGPDFEVRVWDASTGQETGRLAGHRGQVFGLVFHPDGRHLVSAGIDGARAWDLQTGQQKMTIQNINGSTACVAVSPDGERLVTGGWDKAVKVWDWQTGQEVLGLGGHTDMVSVVAFSGDGRRLVSAGLDGTLRLWDATPPADDDPRYGRKLRGHQGAIFGLSFSPDGRYLVTAGGDRTARLWELPAGKPGHTLPGHDSLVTSAAFHARGTLLTTVTADGTLVQWDPATGQRRQTMSGHLGPVLNIGYKVAFSADGERLVSVGKAGTQVWETTSGRPVGQPGLIASTMVFLSQDGKRLAAATPLLKAVQLTEVESGKKVAELKGVSHMVRDLAFSADGRLVAAALMDGAVTVWDLESKKTLHTFHHGDRPVCVAFHPGGRQLASGSCDNTARVWDLDTGQEVETLGGHIGNVMAVAYSPDGKLLATASGNRYEGEVQLWDTATLGKKR
jgi:WD40 repeat protein/serine/threonine protein kinase